MVNRSSLWGALVSLLGLWLLVGPEQPAVASDLSVHSRTSLEWTPIAEGRRFVAGGRLVDNLHQGLSQRLVLLRLAPAEETAGQWVIEHTLQTNRNGRFRFAELLEEGDWSISARYAGDRWHSPCAAQTLLTIERHPLRLQLVVPVASPVWADIPVDIRVESPDHTARWVIDLRVNGVSQDWPLSTDDDGVAQVRIGTVGRVGLSHIQAHFYGDDVYLPASASASILVYQTAEIHLYVAEIIQRREDTLLAIRGLLESDVGPIAGAAVQVRMEGHSPQWTIQTDQNGEFELLESLETIREPGLYMVRILYRPHDTDDREMQVEMSAQVEISAGPFAKVVDWAEVAAGGLAGLLVCLLLATQLVNLTRARRRASAPIPPPGHAIGRSMVELSLPAPKARPEYAAFSGVVRDADSLKPVGPGELWVEDLLGEGRRVIALSNQGEFDSGRLASDRYRVHTRVAGYVTTDFEVTIPHRGQYQQIDVYVCSVRAWIRYLYKRFTVELDLSDDGERVWGRLTPRQIEDVIVQSFLDAKSADRDSADFARFKVELERAMSEGRGPSSGQLVRGLTLLVQDVYYSSRLYEEDLIQLCRGVVKALKEAIDDNESQHDDGR